jgi:hypothetical protein
MLVILVLGFVALIGTAFTGGLLLVVIGIHRGDQGKRRAGQPSNFEAVARRLLTGSRGYDTFHDAGEGR